MKKKTSRKAKPKSSVKARKLLQKIAEVESDLRLEKCARRQSIEDQNDLKEQLNRLYAWKEVVEGQEVQSRQEIKWLRETLRLVTVPKGKEVELSKAILNEQTDRYGPPLKPICM